MAFPGGGMDSTAPFRNSSFVAAAFSALIQKHGIVQRH
jgi:hypothetical protein